MNEQATCYDDALLGDIFDELFPICRSISGPGLRDSLAIIGRYMPLQQEQIATGTPVFDWDVPPEWHIRAARLTGPDGRVVVDFANSNLHVVNYSAPVDQRLSLTELRKHLHSLPALPDAIPYVTSYYQRNWGFCLTDHQLRSLPEGDYHAFIDSEFVDGGIDIAQTVLPGESEKEILLSSYLCHPSLANNELSGPLVLLGLYHRLRRWPRRRFSYRFLLNPETIGSLCFLHRYQEHLRKTLSGGLVLTCLGGPDTELTYKQSRMGEGIIDRVLRHIASFDDGLGIRSFTPESGSDERQYCSPGFNFPVGNIVRTAYGRYPGYHNSLDTRAFMDIGMLVDSIDRIEAWLQLVEVGSTYANQSPFGEPHLSKYDLYPGVNSASTRTYSNDSLKDGRKRLALILQALSHSDGQQPLVALAERLGIGLPDLSDVVDVLEDNGLLKHCG